MTPLPTREDIPALNDRYRSRPPEEIVAWAAATFGSGVKMGTAFGAEGCVLIDIISNVAPGIPIFTLDTGRLNDETYEVMERIRERYSLDIEVYFPDRVGVEELLRKKGFYSFRNSVDDRRECCRIRKVEPLGRATAGIKGWLTGLRKEQAEIRAEVEVLEWDEAKELVKINPLATWTIEQVWHYIRENNVPVNRLHHQGYPSIGCAPCTRAIARGEDIRAGRWWWESPEHKECGIHR